MTYINGSVIYTSCISKRVDNLNMQQQPALLYFNYMIHIKRTILNLD